MNLITYAFPVVANRQINQMTSGMAHRSNPLIYKKIINIDDIKKSGPQNFQGPEPI